MICLALAQVLLGCSSERRWLRFASRRLGQLFPYLPTPRPTTAACGGPGPGRPGHPRPGRHTPSWGDPLRLIDSTPVPCAGSRETVKRSALAGHAGYGYGKRHHRYFWGFRLYVLAGPGRPPSRLVSGHAKLGEREVSPPCWTASVTGCDPGVSILADKGFAGRELEQLVAGYGASLLRPDRADEPHRQGHWAASGSGSRAPSRPQRPARAGAAWWPHPGRVGVRVAQRLLALAAGIWWNWEIAMPDKRSLIAYDH